MGSASLDQLKGGASSVTSVRRAARAFEARRPAVNDWPGRKNRGRPGRIPTTGQAIEWKKAGRERTATPGQSRRQKNLEWNGVKTMSEPCPRRRHKQHGGRRLR